ncbi:RNA-binding (RRM/RBD/RNP motifs) family protein [Actinidia rufa]|uniref:RNA-binding (RRM/RBD/RNP motifs) family protein n=1 Tax=Actinidia rufa TaxID=165716 RepID=A0A7J0F5W5_9ERIC|nr:RNA-binding (RRM/RBD/RNP motifs) family protein [Actinidia rufa]
MDADVDMSAADDDALKELDEMTKRLKEMEDEAAALREMQAKVEKEISAVQDPANEAATQPGRKEVDSRSIFVGNVDYACTPEEVQQHFQSCGAVNRVTILTDKFGQPKGFAYVEFVEVDYACTPEEVQQHFQSCGAVNRVTILTDKFGQPKGFAYVEFVEVDYACTPEEVQQHFQSCGAVNRVTILTDKFGQPKGFAYVEFVEVEAVQEALLLNASELHGRQLKVMAKRTNVPGMQYRARRYNPYMGYGFRRHYVPPYFYSPYGYG